MNYERETQKKERQTGKNGQERAKNAEERGEKEWEICTEKLPVKSWRVLRTQNIW